MELTPTDNAANRCSQSIQTQLHPVAFYSLSIETEEREFGRAARAYHPI